MLHASAYFQYVPHITTCKYDHVATVVAGPDLPVTRAFASRLRCHFQWHEGSRVQTHNMLALQNETCQIQLNLD